MCLGKNPATPEFDWSKVENRDKGRGRSRSPVPESQTNSKNRRYPKSPGKGFSLCLDRKIPQGYPWQRANQVTTSVPETPTGSNGWSDPPLGHTPGPRSGVRARVVVGCRLFRTATRRRHGSGLLPLLLRSEGRSVVITPEIVFTPVTTESWRTKGFKIK